jgi:putative aldouronate transport system substrate-binding protein
MMMAMYIAWLYGQEYSGFMETDIPAGQVRSMLDNDSYYKRALQFIFTANQMGLLDPDSPTQHYDDQLVKMTAGRVLFSVPTWGTTPFKSTEREAAGIGFKLVPFRNEKVFSQGAPFPIGMPWAYAIGRGTKKLDAALKYIDYMFSYDGLWAMVNGRKGVKWDLDEKGEPYLTKTGWDISRGFSDFPNGGKDQDGIGVITAWGLAPRSVHPVYKRQIDTLDWTRKDFAPPDTALDADWKKVMGAIDDVDYLTQHNMIAVPPFAPMGTPPDDIRQIDSRIGDVVKTVSWQMVYARTQAEFDRLWADMVQRAKGMGLDTSMQWYTQEYARANAFGAQYR